MGKVQQLYWIGLIFLFSFCTLTNDGKNTQDINAVVGTWYWKESKGGIGGSEIISPKSTGVHKKLVFAANKKVTVFTNGIETGSYTYTIKRGNSFIDDKEHYLLTFSEMSYVIQYIDKQYLSIQDNFVDGYVLTYTK